MDGLDWMGWLSYTAVKPRASLQSDADKTIRDGGSAATQYHFSTEPLGDELIRRHTVPDQKLNISKK